MLTIEQLQDLYSQGTHVFTESHLANILLPYETKIWLTDTGLPATNYDIAMGIRFFGEATPVSVKNKNYLPVAYQYDMAQPIALEEHSGAVYNIAKDEPVIIANDLPSFLEMLYNARA